MSSSILIFMLIICERSSYHVQVKLFKNLLEFIICLLRQRRIITDNDFMIKKFFRILKEIK